MPQAVTQIGIVEIDLCLSLGMPTMFVFLAFNQFRDGSFFQSRLPHRDRGRLQFFTSLRDLLPGALEVSASTGEILLKRQEL